MQHETPEQSSTQTTEKPTIDQMSLKELVELGIKHLDAVDKINQETDEGRAQAGSHLDVISQINKVLASPQYNTMLGHQIILDKETLSRKSRVEQAKGGDEV